MRLSDEDYAYFAAAMERKKQADSVVAFVQSVLIEKYGLTTGDQIQPDGQIVRRGVPDGPAQ